MPIVSSIITETSLQVDGRFRVVEKHLDEYGIEYLVTYLSAPGFDRVAAMLARAVPLYANRTEEEITQNIGNIISSGSLNNLTLKYSTRDENILALRQTYRNASKQDAVMIGDVLSTLTDAQLRNIFILTQPQVATFRANKLTPATNVAAAIRSSVGE